ncbi:MAG: hypothetical protein ABI632_07585, partial [Pseudolysinimonas sp.]
MALFKPRNSAVDDPRPRIDALVIAADAPPQGAPSSGPYSHGEIRVLIDTPATRHRQLAATFDFADDRWVAPGMTVPVIIDAAQPDSFVVDWAAVPAMQQQAEANLPALADPFAASRRIAAALGITPSEKTASQAERFQQALADAATASAPAGRVRAVAMVSTLRGRFSSSSGADEGGPTRKQVTLTSPSAAVLSVSVPGRDPYAVYLPKFKIPSRHLVIPGEAMPATVSDSDPTDIQLIWEEAPSLNAQIADRMADSMRASESVSTALTQQVEEATSR